MFESPAGKSTPEEKTVKTGRNPLDRVGAALSTALWEHAGDPEAPAPYSTLIDPEAGPFQRTKALFGILRDVVPDAVFNKLTRGRYQHHGEVLPIDPKRYQFETKKVGSGSECSVYRLTSLDPAQPSFVIKIDNGVRRDVDVLVERGKELRAEHAEMREWYRDIPEFIPDEMQFIGKSPTGGRNALFTLQEYIGTADQIHDLFRGQTKAELIDILRQDPALRATFLTFASVTLEKAEIAGEMIDSIGDRNIVMIDQADGGKALRYLDPHGKYKLATVSEKKRQVLQADLDFLWAVRAAVTE